MFGPLEKVVEEDGAEEGTQQIHGDQGMGQLIHVKVTILGHVAELFEHDATQQGAKRSSHHENGANGCLHTALLLFPNEATLETRHGR